jgi:hypothetical protein
MQKPRFMGCCEPPVQWSLQGKKVPKWHFFEILGAKRNKLLGYFRLFASERALRVKKCRE